MRLLNEDDGGDHQESDGNNEEERVPSLSQLDCPHRLRERGSNRREDEQRHTVTDTLLGDELSHPHDETGTGRHRDDHQENGVPSVVGQKL